VREGASGHGSTVRFMARPRFPLVRLGDRPRFLTVGLLRFAGLCGVIVLIGMLPGRLTPYEAGWIGWTGLAVLAVAVSIPFFVEVHRLTERLPRTDAVLLVVRHAGLVGLGAAFFLLWTFVYLTLWWRHPAEAFTGLGLAPRFADFFYYAVTTAFISPPDDIVAHSRGVRSATMIEMLTGLALLATYVSSFVDWGRREETEGQAATRKGASATAAEPPSAGTIE